MLAPHRNYLQIKTRVYKTGKLTLNAFIERFNRIYLTFLFVHNIQ